MNHLLKRIWGRIKITAEKFSSDSHFSVYYAILRVADELGGRIGLHKLSRNAHLKKDSWIMEYLSEELAPVVENYKNSTEQGIYQENAPIWVCWWTGINTAPELVQRCVESIYRNAGDHPVHFITRDNYSQYLEIPDYLLNKLESKAICIANFTDYLRFSLLEQYGGLWLDATIFCTDPIPRDFFSMPLFSCKGGLDTGAFISKYRWTSFCFGGFKGHLLFKFFRDAFELYWHEHDVAIDYLFVDYVINLGYENIIAIKQNLDAIPINNLARDDLQAAMGAALPAESLETVLQPDTALYKLSWRESYSETTADGGASIYQRFLKQ